MKVKIIVDLLNKDSLDIISFFTEYKKTHPMLDLDLHAISINGSAEYNRLYYGLYYSNKLGVGLEYLQRVLEGHFNEGIDVTNLAVLADCYKEIGHDKDDFIDAMMEGDYEEMHDYYQTKFRLENTEGPFTAFIYDKENMIFTNIDETINYINNK